MIKIINMIIEKFSFTNGMLPNKYPTIQIGKTHVNPPTILYNVNLDEFILPTPAIKGTKVRMKGKKRPMIKAFPPCLL